MNNSGFNNGANNGQITTNSDYTVNTESLVGKPSSYFQNNNASTWSNTGGFGGYTSNGFSTNANMGTNANFGANPSFATTPNSIATSTAQNQTPTPWSYDEPAPQPRYGRVLRNS